MDGYEEPMGIYENSCQRRQNYSISAKTERTDATGATDAEDKKLKTPSWLAKVLVGMSICIALMLIGLIACIAVISQERNEFRKFRQCLENNGSYVSDSGGQPVSQLSNLEEQLQEVKLTLAQTHSLVQEANNKAQSQYKEISILNETVRVAAQKGVCNIWYRKKCFHPIKVRGSYQGSENMCQNNLGRPANIYDKSHMDMVMEYIRSTMTEERKTEDFYLGMTFSSTKVKRRLLPNVFLSDLFRSTTLNNSTVSLYDGKPAPYLIWDDNYPTTSPARTAMLLRVNFSPLATDQYFWNVSPTGFHYVLCEM